MQEGRWDAIPPKRDSSNESTARVHRAKPNALSKKARDVESELPFSQPPNVPIRGRAKSGPSIHMVRLFRNESPRTTALANRHAQGTPLPFATAVADADATGRQCTPTLVHLGDDRRTQCGSHSLPARNRCSAVAFSGNSCAGSRNATGAGATNLGSNYADGNSDPNIELRFSRFDARCYNNRPRLQRNRPRTGCNADAHSNAGPHLARRCPAGRSSRGFPALFSDTRLRPSIGRRHVARPSAKGGARSRHAAS